MTKYLQCSESKHFDKLLTATQVLCPKGQRITVISKNFMSLLGVCHSFAVCDINYIAVTGKTLCLGR